MKEYFRYGVLALGLFVSLEGFSMPIAHNLEGIDGKPATMDSDSKKVLVVFWATWCPTCRSKFTSELPELVKENKDLEIITVNTDKNRERAQSYVDSEKISFRVFRDPSNSFRKKLGAFSVPHWAVYKRTNKEKEWKLINSQGAFDLMEVKEALKDEQS